MKNQLEYYCTQCKRKIVTGKVGYIECPQCESGRYIIDYKTFAKESLIGAENKDAAH